MVSGSEVVRVLLVDDDPAIRAALASMLATDPSLSVVAQAHDGVDALSVLDQHRVDVVLLDLRMPRGSGFTVLDRLRTRAASSREAASPSPPSPRVIVLTTYGDADSVRRAIAAGADGFLLKSGDPRVLLDAIHGTAAGQTWLAPDVATFVADDTRRRSAARDDARRASDELARLSPREHDVARLVARGLTNGEVGTHLHLSESTVKAYLSSALDRLGLRNRVELAVLVWQSLEA